jgi:hypothetical protein
VSSDLPSLDGKGQIYPEFDLFASWPSIAD